MVDLTFLNQFKQPNAKGIMDLRTGAQELFEVIVNKSSGTQK
jgi:hypothetical protein